MAFHLGETLSKVLKTIPFLIEECELLKYDDDGNLLDSLVINGVPADNYTVEQDEDINYEKQTSAVEFIKSDIETFIKEDGALIEKDRLKIKYKGSVMGVHTIEENRTPVILIKLSNIRGGE